MKNLQILDDFREHILNNRAMNNKDWELYQKSLFGCGIAMEETLKYLYNTRPSTDTFYKWLLQHTTNNEENEIIDDVLTPNDLTFWDKNGYIVIKNAICKEDCEQTQAAIWAYLNASLDDPESWYSQHEAKEGLMVLFTKHPTLEKNRACAKIRRAYEQLYKTNKIYKTIDKVSFNPPETDTYKFKGSPLHWDVSLHPPISFRLQGLLYLTDVKVDSGGFHCVAGFHHQFDNWLRNIPRNANPRDVAIQELQPIPVLGNAGDFIIWHQALPHCATPNRGTHPRMVQYLTYLPIEEQEEMKMWI